MKTTRSKIQIGPVTRRGENTCNDIVADENAYGATGPMSIADLHQIIDSLHTHFMDHGAENDLLGMLSKWMDELDRAYETHTHI